MNKKVLTLCAGFLLAGGLNAFAESLPIGGPASEIKSDQWYYLVDNQSTKWVYGFLQDENDENKVIESVIPLAASTLEEDEYNNYLWKVELVTLSAANESPVKYGYKLTNKGIPNRQLFFNTDGTVDTDYSDANPEAVGQGTIFLQGGVKYTGTSAKFYAGISYPNGVDGLLALTNGSTAAGDKLGTWPSANSYTFDFYEYKDVEMGDNLNELYNSIGFNFGIAGEEDGKVDNIFDQEGVRIRAIQLTDDVKSNDGDFGFPEGTYFVTETPDKSFPADNNNDAQYDYLMNCTFIAASPSLNDINLAADRKTGKGFQLTTISAKDLAFNNYMGKNKAEMSQGEAIYAF